MPTEEIAFGQDGNKPKPGKRYVMWAGNFSGHVDDPAFWALITPGARVWVASSPAAGQPIDAITVETDAGVHWCRLFGGHVRSVELDVECGVLVVRLFATRRELRVRVGSLRSEGGGSTGRGGTLVELPRFYYLQTEGGHPPAAYGSTCAYPDPFCPHNVFPAEWFSAWRNGESYGHCPWFAFTVDPITDDVWLLTGKGPNDRSVSRRGRVSAAELASFAERCEEFRAASPDEWGVELGIAVTDGWSRFPDEEEPSAALYVRVGTYEPSNSIDFVVRAIASILHYRDVQIASRQSQG